MTDETIQLTIDGRIVSAQPGATVLEACRANGIDVPSLCHYDGLHDIGACRICIVEIEGQRRPVTSCTTPVAAGMVVRTETPALQSLRKQTLELIFGERNHICPFCPRSGNCELQNQAYRHGMDHVRYDYMFPQLAVDNTHPFMTLDHNRCILCTRCIRACDEWVGAHVLDLDHRGHLTTLIADSGVPLGESSCISCGTCLTVCPTGALFEKRSAHWQGRLPKQEIQTICPGCGVGCRINASVQHRQIGEVTSAGGPGANRILCQRGRYGLVNPQTGRIDQIQIRRGKQWVNAPLSNILADITRRLESPQVREDPSRVIALVSPRLPLEAINACHSFLKDVVKSRRLCILDRANTESVRNAFGTNGQPAPLSGFDEMEEADMYLLAGCNFERSHGALGSCIRRGVQQRGARLVKINPVETWLADRTHVLMSVERGKDHLVLSAILKCLIDDGVNVNIPVELATKLKALDDADLFYGCGIPADQIREAARLYREAKRPMVVCGRGVTRQGPEPLAAAFNLVKATNNRTATGRWRLVELSMGANSAGARLLGRSELDIENFDPHTAEIAFVVLSDEEPTWPRDWLNKLRTVTYVVAMIAREHEVLDVAHAVVPTPAWAERSGAFVNFEGRVQRGKALMPPLKGAVDEAHFFATLSKTWRGLSYPWTPPGLPDSVRYVAEGHLAPSSALDATIDTASLEALLDE